MGQPSSKIQETINLPIASKLETDNSEANTVSHTFLRWVGATITIVLLISLSCFLAYKYKSIMHTPIAHYNKQLIIVRS